MPPPVPPQVRRVQISRKLDNASPVSVEDWVFFTSPSNKLTGGIHPRMFPPLNVGTESDRQDMREWFLSPNSSVTKVIYPGPTWRVELNEYREHIAKILHDRKHPVALPDYYLTVNMTKMIGPDKRRTKLNEMVGSRADQLDAKEWFESPRKKQEPKYYPGPRYAIGRKSGVLEEIDYQPRSLGWRRTEATGEQQPEDTRAVPDILATESFAERRERIRGLLRGKDELYYLATPPISLVDYHIAVQQKIIGRDEERVPLPSNVGTFTEQEDAKRWLVSARSRKSSKYYPGLDWQEMRHREWGLEDRPGYIGIIPPEVQLPTFFGKPAPTPIYFEKFATGNCGMIALNNLLQIWKFTTTDANEVIEYMGRRGRDREALHGRSDYDMDVLETLLKHVDSSLTLQVDQLEKYELPEENTYDGFLVFLQSHWSAIVKTKNKDNMRWWFLDCRRNHPEEMRWYDVVRYLKMTCFFRVRQCTALAVKLPTVGRLMEPRLGARIELPEEVIIPPPPAGQEQAPRPEYFETQKEFLCGLHALNNLLQMQKFTREDATIVIDDMVSDIVNPQTKAQARDDLEQKGGNYDVQVLVELMTRQDDNTRTMGLWQNMPGQTPDPVDTDGFVINPGMHWYAIIKTENAAKTHRRWWVLNSTKEDIQEVVWSDVLSIVEATCRNYRYQGQCSSISYRRPLFEHSNLLKPRENGGVCPPPPRGPRKEPNFCFQDDEDDSQCAKEIMRICTEEDLVEVTHLFKIKSQFGAGKSGAFVFLIEDTYGYVTGVKKELCVLKYYAGSYNDEGTPIDERPFRELVTQCRMSGVDGYPCLYWFGCMKTPYAWFNKLQSTEVPRAKTGAFGVQNVTKGTQLMHVQLRNLDQEQISAIAARLLVLIEFARRRMGNDFQHFDLHPENIFIDTECKDLLILELAKDNQIAVPCPGVNLIDFDLVRGENIINLPKGQPQLDRILPEQWSRYSSMPIPERTIEWGVKVVGAREFMRLFIKLQQRVAPPDIKNWILIVNVLLHYCSNSPNKCTQKAVSSCINAIDCFTQNYALFPAFEVNLRTFSATKVGSQYLGNIRDFVNRVYNTPPMIAYRAYGQKRIEALLFMFLSVLPEFDYFQFQNEVKNSAENGTTYGYYPTPDTIQIFADVVPLTEPGMTQGKSAQYFRILELLQVKFEGLTFNVGVKGLLPHIEIDFQNSQGHFPRSDVWETIKAFASGEWIPRHTFYRITQNDYYKKVDKDEDDDDYDVMDEDEYDDDDDDDEKIDVVKYFVFDIVKITFEIPLQGAFEPSIFIRTHGHNIFLGERGDKSHKFFVAAVAYGLKRFIPGGISASLNIDYIKEDNDKGLYRIQFKIEMQYGPRNACLDYFQSIFHKEGDPLKSLSNCRTFLCGLLSSLFSINLYELCGIRGIMKKKPFVRGFLRGSDNLEGEYGAEDIRWRARPTPDFNLRLDFGIKHTETGVKRYFSMSDENIKHKFLQFMSLFQGDPPQGYMKKLMDFISHHRLGIFDMLFLISISQKEHLKNPESLFALTNMRKELNPVRYRKVPQKGFGEPIKNNPLKPSRFWTSKGNDPKKRLKQLGPQYIRAMEPFQSEKVDPFFNFSAQDVALPPGPVFSPPPELGIAVVDAAPDAPDSPDAPDDERYAPMLGIA